MWGCTHAAEPPALPRSRLHPGLLSPTRGSQGGTQAPGKRFLTPQVPDPAGSRGGHELGSNQEALPAAAPSPAPSRCREEGTQPRCPQGGQVPLGCWEGTSLHPSVTGGHSQRGGGGGGWRHLSKAPIARQEGKATSHGVGTHLAPLWHRVAAAVPRQDRGGHQRPLGAQTRPSPCSSSPCGTPEPFPAPGAARQPRSQGWGRGWVRRCQSTVR